jgi:hypothetical protein
MSGRLTFICDLEANLGLSCVRIARRLPLRLFISQWTAQWSAVSAIDSNGRTICIVDAHRDGKRFVVRADEILTAFLEAERAIHQFAVSLLS